MPLITAPPLAPERRLLGTTRIRMAEPISPEDIAELIADALYQAGFVPKEVSTWEWSPKAAEPPAQVDVIT